MFQEMLQVGSGEIKSASGTILDLDYDTLVSVDCGFKPTIIVVYANTYRDVTELTAEYFENATIEKTTYKYNTTVLYDQTIELTPTENGFTIKQTITRYVNGNNNLNYIAMKE